MIAAGQQRRLFHHTAAADVPVPAVRTSRLQQHPHHLAADGGDRHRIRLLPRYAQPRRSAPRRDRNPLGFQRRSCVLDAEKISAVLLALRYVRY